MAHCRGRLLRRGHREAGRAAALSRGQRYAVAVFFLQGATDQRRLLLVAHCRGRLLRRGHREAGRAAALSRGQWHTVAVVFLEGDG